MRIIKITALAVLLGVPFGSTFASAADLYTAEAAPVHPWFQHHHHHCIGDFLRAIFHHDKAYYDEGR